MKSERARQCKRCLRADEPPMATGLVRRLSKRAGKPMDFYLSIDIYMHHPKPIADDRNRRLILPYDKCSPLSSLAATAAAAAVTVALQQFC